ncbi:hypothetical protein FS837_009931 [Tulasnella sp. UAMH 9824]|nr:hypothetical protein FS837_009931 [Tulasnella sp. UAMH 9824]
MASESTKLVVDGILFDMDGTLIDSTPGVLGAWDTFKKDYPHLDLERILRTSHGVRSIDTLRKELQLKDDPDESKLRAEVTRFEVEVIAKGLVLLPGVLLLLDQLSTGPESVGTRWTIVTSATRFYTPQALKSVEIRIPEHIVMAEDVARGKPHPDPYLKGAENLGLDPAQVVVIEDAPSGVRAGKAAGAKVIGVCTSHTAEELATAQPDFIVKDLTKVSAAWLGDKIELTLETVQV